MSTTDSSGSTADQAIAKNNVSAQTFFSSLVIAIAAFAAQVLLFLIIKGKLPRI